MRVDIPHFDLPFRFAGGQAVVVDQATMRDIQNCVEAIIRTRPGEREGEPEFGIADPTFDLIPADTKHIKQQIEEWEPRATILLEEVPDVVDTLLDKVNVRVSPREFEGA